GGLSFGMRRLVDLLPFVVVGLTELVRRLHPWFAAICGSLLVIWNVVLVANFLYIIKVDRDVGYAGLLTGQLHALRYVPRLLTQGGAVRALMLWRPLHEPFQPGFGLLLLALESFCLLAAVWTVWARRPAAPVRSAS